MTGHTAGMTASVSFRRMSIPEAVFSNTISSSVGAHQSLRVIPTSALRIRVPRIAAGGST
jgi:hypothetical protein